MDNVAQLETDTNFQSRKKITWGVFSVLLLFLVAGIIYYFLYTDFINLLIMLMFRQMLLGSCQRFQAK